MLIPLDVQKSVNGTIKVHQVLWQIGKYDMIFRETSCFVCEDVYCNHTKFVGKLRYEDDININKKNESNQPIDSIQLDNQEKNNNSIKFLSNVLLNPNNKRLDKKVETTVHLLSSLKPENKINLDPYVDIENMVTCYNISGSPSNFSGIFQDFLHSTSQLSSENLDNGESDILTPSIMYDDHADSHAASSPNEI